MNKYYKKQNRRSFRKIIRILGLCIALSGLLFFLYFASPLVLWQLYNAPVFASAGFTSPIPKHRILNQDRIKSLLVQSVNTLRGVDYTNAQNWYPSMPQQASPVKTASYTLSIPSIGIKNAFVTTTDYDLASHLVNYGGTAIPPEQGNTVIFGHSTLPSFYNPKDYKTIFANLHKVKVDDTIIVTMNNVTYIYKIFNIMITEPEDTTPLAQTYDDSYLTLITCTPPGTVWERLILQAKLEKI